MRRDALALIAVACALGACKGKKPRAPTTTLAITIVDKAKPEAPIGARVLLFDAQNQPIRIGTIDLYGKRQGAAACAIAPGVVGSWDGLIVANGTAEVPIGADSCNPS